MITVKIQAKTFSEGVLHVVAVVESDVGTLIGPYALALPEDAADAAVVKAVKAAIAA